MSSLPAEIEDDQGAAPSSDWIKSILKRDYNIQLTMPENRLFPTASVPSPDCKIPKQEARALYVRWIARLLDSTDPSWYENFDPESGAQHCLRREEVAGLDIGTGASAIYPLLALRLYPKWSMYATEIDSTSLRYARENLVGNKLDDCCKVLPRTPTQPFVPAEDELERKDLDFVMTNPPFFSSISEWQDSLSGKGKEKPPDSVCTGAQTEMVYEGEGGGGGDYDFALRLYRESTQTARAKAQWYSVMFGKKQSAHRFVALLQTEKCLNFATFLLGAANRTRRWVVAWSWLEFRPESTISRTEGAPPSLNPWPTDYGIPNQSKQSTQRIQEAAMHILGALPPPFEMKWNEGLGAGVCRTPEILWNRSFRRRSKLIAEGTAPPRSPQEIEKAKEKPVGLGVEVVVEEERVLVRWKQGAQRVWFESFCGFLHEQLRRLFASGFSRLDATRTFSTSNDSAGERTTAGETAGENHVAEDKNDIPPSYHDTSSTSSRTAVRTEDESIGQDEDATHNKRRKLT